MVWTLLLYCSPGWDQSKNISNALPGGIRACDDYSSRAELRPLTVLLNTCSHALVVALSPRVAVVLQRLLSSCLLNTDILPPLSIHLSQNHPIPTTSQITATSSCLTKTLPPQPTPAHPSTCIYAIIPVPLPSVSLSHHTHARNTRCSLQVDKPEQYKLVLRRFCRPSPTVGRTHW